LLAIDGAIQLLDPNKPDERERLLEYFLLGWGLVKIDINFLIFSDE